MFRRARILAAGSIIVTVGLIGPVVSGALAGATSAPVTLPLPSSASDPAYGTLISNPSYESSDHTAGVRLAMVSLNWSLWEPSQGQFSSSYAAQEKLIISGYDSAGFSVGVNLGINHTPLWVLSMTDGQLKDQSAHVSGTGNFEFSEGVRSAAAAYVQQVESTIGQVSYITIGLSASSEALYPATTSNQWWAFDANAQSGGADLPSGQSATPMPGWVPGTSTWNGHAVTGLQVQAWYKWYMGGLTDSLAWEMSALRSAGYNGHFELQLPGDGANPYVYSSRIAADLAPEPYDSYQSMNVGAVYQVMLDMLPDLSGVVIDVTSVGDGSGSPPNNACQASDSSVDYRTNTVVDKWSSPRWLAYLAGLHGLGIIGESTGQNTSSDMTLDLSLRNTCGLIGLMWAFDSQLYQSGTGYATVTDYAKQIGGDLRPQSSLSPATVTYATRTATTTSDPLSLTLTNTGAVAVAVGSVTENGAAFKIASDMCSNRTLAPATTCMVGVTFDPPAGGRYNGTLTVSDNGTTSPQTVNLTGTGVGASASVVSSYAFADQTPNTTSPAKIFQVTNTGPAALNVSSVTVNGQAFAVTKSTCANGDVGPNGGTCSFNVTFTPSAVASYVGTIALVDNTSASPQTISLTGNGADPVAALSPASHQFSGRASGSPSSPASFTLTNSGSVPVTVNAVRVTGTAFTIATDTCNNQPLVSHTSCSVGVRFDPPSAGNFSGTLDISDTGSSHLQTATLTGTGY